MKWTYARRSALGKHTECCAVHLGRGKVGNVERVYSGDPGHWRAESQPTGSFRHLRDARRAVVLALLGVKFDPAAKMRRRRPPLHWGALKQAQRIEWENGRVERSRAAFEEAFPGSMKLWDESTCAECGAFLPDHGVGCSVPETPPPRDERLAELARAAGLLHESA